MLRQEEIDRINALQRELDGIDTNRQRYRVWRDVIHLYEDVVHRHANEKSPKANADFARLFRLASQAIEGLGGLAEPAPALFSTYDHRRYGPFLGVSDEGSAAGRIRDALVRSPKVRALGRIEPLGVGGAVDAERLGGGGEVPVGPDEYRDIQLSCLGRTLSTTNIGTRVNARYFNDPPFVSVPTADKRPQIEDKVRQAIAPFFKTPDGKPRSVTVFLRFEQSASIETIRDTCAGLRERMQSGGFCDPASQRLGLLVQFSDSNQGSQMAADAIPAVAAAGIEELAVEGPMRREAQERISMPGLLNCFDKRTANRLLEKAKGAKVKLRSWKQIDVDTVARNTWTSLQVARSMGIHLGKYGLLPLTTEEVGYVMAKLQAWFPCWTAAPAIYVDCPTVASHRIYDDTEAREAVRLWLDVAHEHGVRVALVDTADKSMNRKLLKESDADRGMLTLEEIHELDLYAGGLGIKVLWAGDISAAQAYKLGRIGVFGIYTTTSTARRIAVSGDYLHDPSLASEKEPTFQGVYRVKLLLEAGFVQSRLASIGQSGVASEISRNAETVMEQMRLQEQSADKRAEQMLAKILEDGWRLLLSGAP